MKTVRRFALAVAMVATIGTGAVLAFSTTSFGAAFLRQATHGLIVNANAGAFGGNMTLTISPNASLLARVDAVVTVTYTCDQLYDPFFGFPVPASQTSGNINVSVQQRSGHLAANGNGGTSTMPACDAIPGFFSGTVNSTDVVVAASGAAFKKGSAVAQAFGSACENGGFTSFGPPPCDSGQSASTVISIR
jgi:hypothetical protein